jgi:hypothetical protein
MTAKTFTLRVSAATLEHLERTSRARHEPKSRLAKRFIEEGLRMDAHPGIVFRDGPTGRRAAVSGGPDVWEIIPVIKNVDSSGEQAIVDAARWLELTERQVRAAVGYYAEYAEEIDERIRRNDELAERAEAAWQREQEVLAR